MPLGVARETPPDGIANVYAVNIGSSGAARVAYRIAETSDQLLALEQRALSLGRFASRLPYLWP